MSKKKTALVLEGGGMRGAFTAGALAWLIDNGIVFDSSYGISTGAVYLTDFLLKRRQNLFDLAVDGIVDKRLIGLSALLRCGHFVDYDFLFKTILPYWTFSIDGLKDADHEGFIGVYDLEETRTRYISSRELTYDQLKASTSLPILGKVVTIDGKKYFDGGVTDMIPIDQAIRDGNERFLIITTKPENYVRKPAKAPIVALMRATYPYCPKLAEDYKIRHLNYNRQIETIQGLKKEEKALYIYPKKPSAVTRLGGSREELSELFELGYQEMEDNRQAVMENFGNV